MLFQQDIGRLFALLGVADEERHDMGVVRHHGQAGGVEDRLDPGGAFLVALALPARGFQVADRGCRGRAPGQIGV